jgi:hypothetical protein
VGILVFTLGGEFVETKPFEAEIVCEFPQVDRDGRFVGERFDPIELKKTLTLRDLRGNELARLAEFDLREYFPELEPEKDFFLQDYQVRFYLYGFRNDGGLIWASSDACAVYSFDGRRGGVSTLLFSQNFTPLPIPADQVAEMEKRAERAKQNPLLHMYVPRFYQPVQHLLVAPDGEIWVYVMSAERTGFLVYSPEGELKAHYGVRADFDMTRVKTQIHADGIYYVVPGRNSVKIFKSVYSRIPSSPQP